MLKLQCYSREKRLLRVRTATFLTKYPLLVPAYDIVQLEKPGCMVYRMELIENFDAETVHQKVAIRYKKVHAHKALM